MGASRSDRAVQLLRTHTPKASAPLPGGSRYSERMQDEATAAPRPHVRLLHGMRKPANWLQLVRFGIVGSVGFVVNVGVYAVCVHALAIDYRIAFMLAWAAGVTNNFLLNRHWTFDAAADSVRFQAVRFVVVSLVAAGFGFVLLTVFVESAGIAKVPAEALAVAASTPLNFLGNKLWSFRSR